MKNILILSALLTVQAAPAQERFVSHSLEGYYEWFHEQSQVADHYQQQTTLYTFLPGTAVYEGPCPDSSVKTTLPAGLPVTNLSYEDEYYLPQDEIDGYGDFWYHVAGRTPDGKPFNGYVWGAGIAKGYRHSDLNGDGQNELLMLGISSQPRVELRDIKAEIRVLRDGELITAKSVPGLCVFEDCASSPLIRVFSTQHGFPIIEASTMTIGCWAGIEKAFYYFDGANLTRVYHAEYTTQQEIANEPFIVSQKQSAQLCRYSHEGSNFTPVWKCQPLELDEDRADVALEGKNTLHAK